jgi:hypothetical protein
MDKRLIDEYYCEYLHPTIQSYCIYPTMITQADDCLGITSLSNKLYAYVAVQIWNTSIVDFHLAVKDPTFDKLQQEAIDEWKAYAAEERQTHAAMLASFDRLADKIQ